MLLVSRIPVSTYRLQFNTQFRFRNAKGIIQYLHDLGITDMYASPYFRAKEGSLHGYDIVDPTALNPEVGTEQEYNALIRELHKYGMGQILDIVPNHMCIDSKDNIWWQDILENGLSSRYGDFFDIDWEPLKKDLTHRILIPILGNQYGDVLEAQEIRLAYKAGAFFIHYYEHRFPVIPETYISILKHRIVQLERILTPDNPEYIELLSIITALEHLPLYTETEPEKVAERYREKEIIKKRIAKIYLDNPDIKSFIDNNIREFNGTKGDPESFNLLDELLMMQAYRLSFWRVATEEINYRRFFDINSLAAIRMENPDVFEKSHSLVMKLIGQGKVTGLRIDHPDGLYNPAEYFRMLQRQCFLQTRLHYSERVKKENALPYRRRELRDEILKQYHDLTASDIQFKPFYIVGEKILMKEERMPDDWPIFSTTGYVFLNALNGIFIRTGNAKVFDDIYERFTKSRMNFQEIVYEKKKLIMQVAMSSEINTLGHYLDRLSEKDRHTRDFTLNSLTSAIVEVIAFFPVYRTYIDQAGVNDRDRRYIEFAISKAKRKNPAISESVFDFLKNIFLLNYPDNFADGDKKEWLDFVMRLQQLTGPVMAKGFEDTVFYVYNRLVSLNEVGGCPERFGTSLDTFHGKNIERIKFWPYALITTATHDTKRGEDVRARINVLSEIPDEWKKHLAYWRRLNKRKKPVVEGQMVPDLNEEYLLYQTLIGAWPAGKMDGAEKDVFRGRIREYMLKATREAKVNTSWISPNTIYEEAFMIFVDSVLDDTDDNQFLSDFVPFQKRISCFGMFNSLSQVLLKITSPGIPDFYQGTEFWDFSLVDPDNRRPVDFTRRMEALKELKTRESESTLHELARDLTVNKEDGKVKLFVTIRALNYRRENRELFEKGEYIPLEAMGSRADNVCAFARRLGNARLIAIAPRFLTQFISGQDDLPFGETVWGNSSVIVPIAEPGALYRNIFTHEVIKAHTHKDATSLYLSEVFANFPVAVLERICPSQKTA